MTNAEGPRRPSPGGGSLFHRKRERAANVGIVTLYGSSNFGNRLQNYAVTRALEDVGLSPETLVLRPVLWRGAWHELLKRSAARLRLPGTRMAKQRSFMDFDRRVPTRLVWSRRHLKALSERYSLVVCGSDQIWKPYNVSLGGAAFADFFPGKKVAVSPSLGVDSVTERQVAVMAPLLATFDALSVREFSGQEILRRVTGYEVPVLIDPTLSLTAEEWLEVSDRRMVPRRPFVLVLLLGPRPAGFDDEVRARAARNGLEVEELGNGASTDTCGAGPQDFLALVAGAEYVVSDSYHAAIFSVLFGTDFYLVERDEEHNTSSRFGALQKLLKLQAGNTGPAGSHLLARTSETAEALRQERARFSDFLLRATRSDAPTLHAQGGR